MAKIYIKEEAFEIARDERLKVLKEEFYENSNRLNNLIIARENLYIDFKLGFITKEKFEVDTDIFNKEEVFLRSKIDSIKETFKILDEIEE